MSRTPVRHVPRASYSVALFIAIAGIAAATALTSPQLNPPAPASTAGESVDGTALNPTDTQTMLASIPDRSRTTVPPYDRVVGFGSAWQDVDGAGCDPRNRVLARDLLNVRHAADGCTVLSGTLDDPYTGAGINFTRGVDTSFLVQIDHVKSTTRPCFCSEVADHIGNGMPLTCVRGS